MKPQSVSDKQDQNQPDKSQAEQAVKTILSYLGEDPQRTELLKTPARFIKAFEEHCSGYQKDPVSIFGSDFEPADNYNDFVCLTDIPIHSHCQHHIHPIIGKAHIAYWPGEKLAGLSKVARATHILSKRLVSQESLTTDIRECLEEVLAPKGVAVLIAARHLCISTRGVNHPDMLTTTTAFSGIFDSDPEVRQRFLDKAY